MKIFRVKQASEGYVSGEMLDIEAIPVSEENTCYLTENESFSLATSIIETIDVSNLKIEKADIYSEAEKILLSDFIEKKLAADGHAFTIEHSTNGLWTIIVNNGQHIAVGQTKYNALFHIYRFIFQENKER